MIGPEKEFLFADVGMNGRNSHGGNLSQDPLKITLENNSLNFPNLLPYQTKKFSFICTGDTFPLFKFMMEPYP